MRVRLILSSLVFATAATLAAPAAAHCDTLDGPVVAAARSALDSGEVERALIWVQKADERAVRHAFTRARSARAAGGAAAQTADTAFYATLVRIHRKGEGAGYTGLKPAGRIEPPVAAADHALERGQPAEVEKVIVEYTIAGLRQRFDAVNRTSNFDSKDVAAGRAHVAAYVDYVHYVERVYEAAGASAAHAVPTTAPRTAAVHDAAPGHVPAKHTH